MRNWQENEVPLSLPRPSKGQMSRCFCTPLGAERGKDLSKQEKIHSVYLKKWDFLTFLWSRRRVRESNAVYIHCIGRRYLKNVSSSPLNVTRTKSHFTRVNNTLCAYQRHVKPLLHCTYFVCTDTKHVHMCFAPGSWYIPLH